MHSYQLCPKVPVVLHPCRYLVLPFFFLKKSRFSRSLVVSHGNVNLYFLTLNDMEHLSGGLFATLISLVKCLFSSHIPSFKIGLLKFHHLILRVLYIRLLEIIHQKCDLQIFSRRWLFCKANVFHFGKVQFIKFLHLWIVILVM